jgi:Flp pilus assembly protein TadG
VIRLLHLGTWLRSLAARAWRDDSAAQIVEFAVSLPLLVVFVVGIFDFSNAFTLKQKLTNAVRDGARVAAADPASDLSSAAPASVIDAFQVVHNNLLANKINDCGIDPSGGLTPTTTSGLTWTYTGITNCPPGGLTITINRGYYFPANSTTLASVTCSSQPVTGGLTAVIGTCVSIQYAYPWRFGKVASLLGSAASLPTQVTATAVAMNEN